MAQKKPPAAGTTTGALTHSPFADLAKNPQLVAGLAKSSPPPLAAPRHPPRPLPPLKVRLRLESRGRSGKVVTRISGLPTENLEPIASRLRKGLGCGATIEEGDVILQGSLVERGSEWLERVGDLRAIREEPDPRENRASTPANANPPVPRAAALPAPRTLSGVNRADVTPGRRVAIVQKADQLSGKQTEGVVRDVLTSSATHPRGIKVRLVSGEVGRVKMIY